MVFHRMYIYKEFTSLYFHIYVNKNVVFVVKRFCVVLRIDNTDVSFGLTILFYSDLLAKNLFNFQRNQAKWGVK